MAVTLPIPPALYDYVLYYECASKDWIKGAKKTTIKGDGSLMKLINWNVTYSYDPNDSGGNTKFGVTESTWKAFVKKYPKKGYSEDLNSMNQKSWLDVIKYYWEDYSYGGKSANHACAFALFQMAWGGFNSTNLRNLLNTLKKNADIKDYNFINSTVLYKSIADATHAYKDPMVAYDYIRRAKSTYLYNISTPNKKNHIYRCGWLTRNTLSFNAYGLYVPTTFSYKSIGLKYDSTLEDWESVANTLAQNNTSGYVKIMDWERSAESIANIPNSFYFYNNVSNSNSNSNTNGFYYPDASTYDKCGNVNKLGQFVNSSYTQTTYQQSQSREEILNTLVKGSYTPENIKKCTELITADKKKNIKT